jgi:ankyrin repeat protein
MKKRIMVLLLAAALLPQGWAVENLTKTLQRGLIEEEANRDFPAAIEAYEQVLAKFEQHRQIAATALFRLGECYRKLGRTEEAAAAFEQLLGQFNDQELLVKLARQNLQLLRPDTPALLAETPAAQPDPELVEIQQIERTIRNNPDFINAPGEGGLTPLHRAARDGKSRLIQFLLENGAQANRKDNSGWTPLHHAVFHAYLEAAELLIAAGAEVNARDKVNGTPLHSAAWQGFTALGKLLLENGAETDAVKQRFSGGPVPMNGTPLVLALEQEHFPFAQLLLDHGVDINFGPGGTALQHATQAGKISTMKWLLERGADPDAGRATPLVSGIRNPEMVAILLRHGADPNKPQWDGVRPLHRAAGHGEVQSAELLHRHGADLNVKGPGGNTPLHHAAESGSLEMIQWLLGQSAEINARNDHGRTPYDLGRRPEVLRLLEEHGGMPAITQVSLVIHWLPESHPSTSHLFQWPSDRPRTLQSFFGEELKLEVAKLNKISIQRLGSDSSRVDRPGPNLKFEEVLSVDPAVFERESADFILKPNDQVVVVADREDHPLLDPEILRSHPPDQPRLGPITVRPGQRTIPTRTPRLPEVPSVAPPGIPPPLPPQSDDQ